HICTLYDVGSADGVEYLVMELLEGQTLADRVEKGPLPTDQVIRFGMEIADALDRAHRAGIVHRDLKPGNVMLTKSGVKLLDFGLAKTAAERREPDLSSLPTQMGASRPLTQKGTVMGTFQYMAPEQLEGKEADGRTDIFALGCVLYEMATGNKAFTGSSQASLVSAILRDEPKPISELAPMAPPALDRLAKTCLAKDPEERWQSARDVMSELRWIGQAGSQAGAPAIVVSRRKNREKLAWFGFAGAALLAALFAIGFLRRAPRPSKPIVAALVPPEKMFVTEFALSPDGTKLAFCALKPGGQPGLWVRSLSEPTAKLVPGAEDVSFPFWSPDSKYVAFFSQGALKRMDAAGGPILTICDTERVVGGTWNRDGTIVFALPTSPLFKVAASGGKPIPVTRLDASLHVTAHRYPSFLPDGVHFLYMAANLSAPLDDPGSSIRVGSLDGKLDKALVPVASNAAYAEGRLFYGRDGSLLAQRIDLSRWEMKGDPVTIGDRLPATNWFGLAPFSISGQTLVYLPLVAVPGQLTWFDRGGRSLGSIGEPRPYNVHRLSPDGRRVAADVFDPARAKTDIWIFDTATSAGTRFVSTNWSDFAPVWSPEGDRIAFASTRKSKGAKPDIWMKRVDGTAEEPFSESPDNRIPEDWSPDGHFLSFNATPATGKRNTQLWFAETGGARKVVPFSVDAFSQGNSRFSPDGRWIAFESDESGKSEVYVRPFPEGTGRWQISPAGGGTPVWRRDGKELYYLAPDFKIMAAQITLSPTFRSGAPYPLFAIHPNGLQPFDVSADGQRFLVDTAPSDQGSPPFSLVLNWTGLLKND
ncbi:MAG TPA: protein kinase, partial [Thermoanaerobaculia bacterium]|nr:protein kinase [Thermoanaerobaculia bacterium]